MSRSTTTGATAQSPKTAAPAPTSTKQPATNQQSGLPQEKVAKLAYEKWLKGGCKHGCDMQHWLEAEAEVRAEMKGGSAQGQTRR
jgi:hypothetical protein